MSFVRIANLTKRFGTHTAVGNVSFDVPQGSTLALLGPSGCGKTTILRCLAGLETPDDGAIEIGGNVVFDTCAGIDLMPEKRELGIVFQSYAVWPHMTVEDNVAFPLKVRGMSKTDRLARASKMLETVGLKGFETRSATLVSRVMFNRSTSCFFFCRMRFRNRTYQEAARTRKTARPRMVNCRE